MPRIRLFAPKDNFKESGGISYLVVSIIIGIAVLTVWQSFYPNLATFGRSWIDYIAAILVGFGSQAVIGEAVYIVRKILGQIERIVEFARRQTYPTDGYTG